MTDAKISRAAKKAPLALIPFIWLYGVARVLAYGAKKYIKGNHYTATLEDGAGERYAGAAMRHVGEMQLPDGTWSTSSLASRDEESGLPHIDHAICSLGILRGILIKEGVLPADPGEGKEPPAATPPIQKDGDPGYRKAVPGTVADHQQRAAELRAAAAREDILIAQRVRDGAYDVPEPSAQPSICVTGYPCRDCQQQEYCAGGCGARR